MLLNSIRTLPDAPGRLVCVPKWLTVNQETSIVAANQWEKQGGKTEVVSWDLLKHPEFAKSLVFVQYICFPIVFCVACVRSFDEVIRGLKEKEGMRARRTERHFTIFNVDGIMSSPTGYFFTFISPSMQLAR